MRQILRDYATQLEQPADMASFGQWVFHLAVTAYEAGRADRDAAAREQDEISGALAEAPWRKRAELARDFDAACADFDARGYVP